MGKTDSVYRKRFEHHMDELRWLYMELYDNGSMYAELCDQMEEFYRQRKTSLRKRDQAREEDPISRHG